MMLTKLVLFRAANSQDFMVRHTIDTFYTLSRQPSILSCTEKSQSKEDTETDRLESAG